jgi:hypothetical protein
MTSGECRAKKLRPREHALLLAFRIDLDKIGRRPASSSRSNIMLDEGFAQANLTGVKFLVRSAPN